jgi:hypothetical protein
MIVKDWKNYSGFAGKMVLILENQKLRQEMENDGAKKVRESFDINMIVTALKNL